MVYLESLSCSLAICLRQWIVMKAALCSIATPCPFSSLTVLLDCGLLHRLLLWFDDKPSSISPGYVQTPFCLLCLAQTKLQQLRICLRTFSLQSAVPTPLLAVCFNKHTAREAHTRRENTTSMLAIYLLSFRINAPDLG